MMDLRSIKYPKGNPSLLASDKSRLQEEVNKAASCGSSFIHIDVMDGIFVPNISFSYDVAKRIERPNYGHPFYKDAHLMIVDPLKQVEAYAEVCDIVTFHLEALENEEDIKKGAEIIKKKGAFAGLAINPETKIAAISPYLSYFDLILLMTVHPGKGGQPFDPNGYNRIRALKNMMKDMEHPPVLEIDGGVNEKTAPEAIKAGAELLVAGSYLYGHDDFAERFTLLEKKQ